jgi:hypothetical protein
MGCHRKGKAARPAPKDEIEKQPALEKGQNF